jgi:hypothetical protein
MDLINLKEMINETGYLNNISIGSYFHIKYRNLYDEIKKHTEELKATYRVNLTLRSRVKFIFDYDCNLHSLLSDGKYLIFDRKSDSFVRNSSNSAKTGWEKIKSKLNNEKTYSFNKTKKLLSELNEDEIFGRSKNRIMCSNKPILYNSILKHSKELEAFDRNTNKFPSKIIFLRDYDGKLVNLLCKKCMLKYVTYNPQKNMFNQCCKNCYYESDDFYPQKGYFKKKYGEEWEHHYNLDRKNIKNKKVNSCEWFINKYGLDVGKEKYKMYVKNMTQNIINLSGSACSKISQELFWLVYDKLNQDEKKECFFNDLNKEILISDGEKLHIPDFVYKNKIIEYDGTFWHNLIKDENRNIFYIKNGYEVLVITDKDFNRQHKPQNIIDKCVKFLKK